MNPPKVFCTDVNTTVLVLFVAIILGTVIGYYARALQARERDLSNTRKITFVNKARLERMYKQGGLIKFPTNVGAIISCPFCRFENVGVVDLENQLCLECSRPIKGGDLFLGLRAHEELWLKGSR